MCLVWHIIDSSAISLLVERNPGDFFKLTYSGDCSPSTSLLSLARDSTVLIHEATFGDELVENATTKFHSTVSQAIEQGMKTNSKYTILTHMSQRYRILPRIDEKLPPNVSFAFDNMEVVESDLERSHFLYETLRPLISVQMSEEELCSEFES